MNNQEFFKNSEITLSSLINIFKKYIVIIVLATVIGGVIMGAYSAFFIKTKYSAKIEFVVVNVLDDNPYISDSMLGAASQITDTCVEIVNRNVLVSEAVKKHNLDTLLGCDFETAVADVSKMLSAEKNGEESSVFSVTALSYDSNVTLKVITAIQDVMPGIVEDLYKLSESSNITTTVKPVTKVDSMGDVAAVNSSVLKYSMLGALAGFCLIYFVVLVVTVLDTKVYGEQTVKSNFEEPIIGTIPVWGNESASKFSRSKKKTDILDKRDYAGKLLNKDTPFAVTEAFNSLRTNILYSVADEKCPVFAVTSDFAGAGKSVVSSNIAVALASLGKKTLLIECDLRRPELSTIFSKKYEYGITDFLAGSVKDDVKIFSDVGYENLSVVFSGKVPPNPSELIGSDSMKRFIEDCRNKFDVIIIDTPPAQISDVAIISSFSSGVIVVARSRYSDIGAIKSAHELINGVNGKIVGYIVNDVDYKGSGYYKNTKYGYSRYYK